MAAATPPRIADARSHVEALVRAAIDGGNPAPVLERMLAEPFSIERPALIAIGKAAPAMYEACTRTRGEPDARLMIVPRGADAPEWALRGAHPVPDDSSAAAGEALLRFVEAQRRRTDCFVVLLSGGASAIAIAPEPGISVADYAETTERLLRAGADIAELNTVRRHIDRIKGGKLRLRMAPAAARLYAASDVAGDEPHIIGSGPLSADPTTFADALAVIGRFAADIPSVAGRLRAGARGEFAENPAPGDPALGDTVERIIQCSYFARTAAVSRAEALGFPSRPGARFLDGPAAETGRAVVEIIRRLNRPRAIVWSGETVVEVGDASGTGGRNQELALAAALAIDGDPGLVIASFGTDGVDGPTDAAGAMATGRTCGIARDLGLNPARALAEHDSHTFFAALDRAGYPHLIRTGPTGVNAQDITIALRY
jgi:hydroxypyruvate reductase